MAKAVVLILSLSVVVGVAVSHENGAPVVRNVCENLMPSTSSPHLRQSGNGGYAITLPPSLRPSGNGYFSYEAGALYDVIITASSNKAEGFLVQAWDPSDARIGTFNPADGSKLLDCSSFSSIPSASTLTHSRENHNSTIFFSWTAPMESNGTVDFKFTIVAGLSEYYGPFSAGSSDAEQLVPPI